MATTTTNVKQIKLNKMTSAQYDAATKSATEFYTVVDESIDYNDLVNTPTLATVATTGSYDDLTNKPVIPASQVNSDWNANSGVAQILNKPTLATVATSGSYNDLSDKPTLNSFTSTAQRNAINSGITSTTVAQITTNKNDITTINSKIPSAATSSNQLADKAFVNSTVQTNAANFRGSWATWSAVPTSASSYPEDYTGSKTPTVNDYMVVQDASGYTGQTLTGTWRFKYTGVWSTNGKNGWIPEYQVNETPMTQAQLNALNSGITSTKVGNYDTHIADTTIHVTSADKTNWDNAVHKTGNESIAGTKTFTTTSTPVVLKNSNQTVTNPTSTTYSNIQYKDKDDNMVVSLSSVTATWGVGLFNQINGKDGFSVLDLNNETGFKINTDTAALRNNPTEDTTTSKQIDTVGARNTKLQSYQPLLVSGTNIKTINNSSILGSGNLTVDGLPSQSGQSGKFLTTNGTTASWADVGVLPSQSGNSGKFLTTNGTTASWAEISEYTASEVETLWNSL